MTTASAMATGMATAKPRSQGLLAACRTTIPSRRFQPKCRLGSAAYAFVSAGGWSAR